MNTPYLVWTRMKPVVAPPARQQRLRTAGLTVREREVARYVASGLSDEEIAQLLVINVGTVSTHLYNASRKLKAATRSQLGMWALCAGLITSDEVLAFWHEHRPEILGPGTVTPLAWMKMRVASLSSRERDAVKYAACGLKNAEIAQVMRIKAPGVRFLLYSAFDRLGVASRSQLAGLTILTDMLTHSDVLAVWCKHKPEMFGHDWSDHVLHSQ
ncbi:MAG: helix-turn-helix transcriptional regulator [Vampirovibrionales bacterium]|nr:helix-turn-helix transcriptional regulator [Vampirovibrionales bacterium]